MKKLLAAFAMAALLIGCASETPKQHAASAFMEMQMLKTKYIKQEHKLAGLGKGVSSDEQVAYEKADQNARVDLAKALDAQVKSITKNFKEQIDIEGKEALSEHFQTASKTKVDTHLNGATLTDVKVEVSEDGKFNVYGVMVLDVNLVNELIESLKSTQSGLSEAQIEKVREVANKAYSELDDAPAAE
ncbi:MAG: LPP20 family lipoprotein [Fibrobacter sp.]|nr:LPP20 family lipoprotein [Fibrobacter sp.]